MGVAERHTQRSVEPVRIDTLADKLKLVVVGLVHGAVSRVILARKPFYLKFFSGTTKVEGAEIRHAEPRHEVVAEPELSFLRAFSLDDDDTVGSLLTIEDGGGCILQHIDSLDVEHVKVVEFLDADLHTVQHDERVVHTLLALIGNQGVGSTDKDGRHSVRVGSRAVVLHQHHARGKGGKTLHQVRRGHGDQLVAAYRSGRACKRFLRLGVKSIDHHSIEAGGLQLHIQPCRGADIVLLRLCSDE